MNNSVPVFCGNCGRVVRVAVDECLACSPDPRECPGCVALRAERDELRERCEALEVQRREMWEVLYTTATLANEHASAECRELLGECGSAASTVARAVTLVANDICNCGGNPPDDCCDACMVYHAVDVIGLVCLAARIASKLNKTNETKETKNV